MMRDPVLKGHPLHAMLSDVPIGALSRLRGIRSVSERSIDDPMVPFMGRQLSRARA